MKTKRLALDAVLTGIALIMFTIELQLPSLTPIPGIKLGLSNIITVYAIFTLSPLDAGMILFSRIFLGALFSGNISALMYSAAGGVLCYIVMLGMRHILSERQLWVASVFGAMSHNLAQIIVAVLVTRTPAIFAYLPVLLISGIVTGLFTGLSTQFARDRILKRK